MPAPLERGFTLLEIVIVVVIIGFLLAGALKGQELITSAKVKRVAGQLDEVRTGVLRISGSLQGFARRLPGRCGGPRLRDICVPSWKW